VRVRVRVFIHVFQYYAASYPMLIARWCQWSNTSSVHVDAFILGTAKS